MTIPRGVSCRTHHKGIAEHVPAHVPFNGSSNSNSTRLATLRSPLPLLRRRLRTPGCWLLEAILTSTSLVMSASLFPLPLPSAAYKIKNGIWLLAIGGYTTFQFAVHASMLAGVWGLNRQPRIGQSTRLRSSPPIREGQMRGKTRQQMTNDREIRERPNQQ